MAGMPDVFTSATVQMWVQWCFVQVCSVQPEMCGAPEAHAHNFLVISHLHGSYSTDQQKNARTEARHTFLAGHYKPGQNICAPAGISKCIAFVWFSHDDTYVCTYIRSEEHRSRSTGLMFFFFYLLEGTVAWDFPALLGGLLEHYKWMREFMQNTSIYVRYILILD